MKLHLFNKIKYLSKWFVSQNFKMVLNIEDNLSNSEVVGSNVKRLLVQTFLSSSCQESMIE